jgi:hypothetical protein
MFDGLQAILKITKVPNVNSRECLTEKSNRGNGGGIFNQHIAMNDFDDYDDVSERRDLLP